MNEKERKAKNAKIKERYQKLREEFWPDIPDTLVWKSAVNKYYATLPKALPLVCRILDITAKGTPVSHVYYSLWCRASEESTVTIPDPKQLAFESGFSGQRALDTWKSRMKILKDLGLILCKPGSSGEFHYILLLHPYKAITKLRTEGTISGDSYYNTWLERVHELGVAKDIK